MNPRVGVGVVVELYQGKYVREREKYRRCYPKYERKENAPPRDENRFQLGDIRLDVYAIAIIVGNFAKSRAACCAAEFATDRIREFLNILLSIWRPAELARLKVARRTIEFVAPPPSLRSQLRPSRGRLVGFDCAYLDFCRMRGNSAPRAVRRGLSVFQERSVSRGPFLAPP